MNMHGIQAKHFANGCVKLCLGLAFALLVAQSAGADDGDKPPVIDLSEYLNPIAEKKAKETERRFAELIREISADVEMTGADEDSDDETEDDKDASGSQSSSDSEDGEESEDASDDEAPVRLAKFQDGRFQLPELVAASIATQEIGNGKTPEGFRKGVPQALVPLPESGVDRGNWDYATEYWAAANTFSHPRYFEDRMLERHGHERFPALQPMISGAHFFGTVPLMPYLMTVSHPCDCEYTLGYLRSGSCVPRYHQRPPFQRDAFWTEAYAIMLGVMIFP